MQKLLITGVFAILLSGCSSTPSRTNAYSYERSGAPVPRMVAFPKDRLPPAAPPSAKQRCESLPPVGIGAGKLSTRDALMEIQKARQAYADCASRHNVLVDFEDKLEKGVMDIYNHYDRQIRH